MKLHLDKSRLRRLNQIEPPIDQDVLADTLCDGELLAVVLDRWIVAQFARFHGVLVNTAVRTDPELPDRIRLLVEKVGIEKTEEKFNKYYDYEILNDPACPKEVLNYVLQSLAHLWEAQCRMAFPERNVNFCVGWDAGEGTDGAYYIQMTP